MSIGLAPELLVFGGVCSGLWVALWRFTVPELRRALQRSELANLPRLSKSLVCASILRDIAFSAVAAVAIILAAVAALNAYVAQVRDTEGELVSLIEIRHIIEAVVSQFQGVSVTLWLTALLILGLIWIAVSRSWSVKSWG